MVGKSLEISEVIFVQRVEVVLSIFGLLCDIVFKVKVFRFKNSIEEVIEIIISEEKVVNF